MRKTLILLCIVVFAFGMVGCDLDDYEDQLFFYTAEVVDGGGETYATWDYQSEGFVVIMTRWDASDKALTRDEAIELKDRTEFTLSLDGTPLTENDVMSVEEFHHGYEVVQRFHFDLSEGLHTLHGTTIDVGVSPSVTYLPRTINLTIR